MAYFHLYLFNFSFYHLRKLSKKSQRKEAFLENEIVIVETGYLIIKIEINYFILFQLLCIALYILFVTTNHAFSLFFFFIFLRSVSASSWKIKENEIFAIVCHLFACVCVDSL